MHAAGNAKAPSQRRDSNASESPPCGPYDVARAVLMRGDNEARIGAWPHPHGVMASCMGVVARVSHACTHVEPSNYSCMHAAGTGRRPGRVSSSGHDDDRAGSARLEARAGSWRPNCPVSGARRRHCSRAPLTPEQCRQGRSATGVVSRRARWPSWTYSCVLSQSA